ncbi:MAG: RNA-binding S4 domain-containing protein [Bacteroidetes bacterium]|nr:RNA-binding S4 domain-containing protein [Bacteroidota bacterium]
MLEVKLRIDKWLWAVRIFKTRSLAAEACHTGKVRIDDIEVKASRAVHPGEVITVKAGIIQKTYRVLGLLEKRVSAKLAAGYVEDLTPPEEYKKLELQRDSAFILRDRGAGRPTKKERRIIDKLKHS